MADDPATNHDYLELPSSAAPRVFFAGRGLSLPLKSKINPVTNLDAPASYCQRPCAFCAGRAHELETIISKELMNNKISGSTHSFDA